MLAAVPVATVYPETAVVALLAGYVGGVFPDFDLLVGEHRRTLHFPVYYWVAALIVGLCLSVAFYPALVFGLCFLMAGALHSGMDALGAGVEPRPWERTNKNAVYVHALGRWASARYLVPYDGSPRDLAVVALVSAGVLVTSPVSGVVTGILILGLAISIGYTLIRRRIPRLEEQLSSRNH